MDNRQARYYLEELQRMMTQHRDIFTKEFVSANGMAIQALERMKARWDMTDYMKCTNCGFTCDDPYYLGDANYCPECGAEMEVEE